MSNIVPNNTDRELVAIDRRIRRFQWSGTAVCAAIGVWFFWLFAYGGIITASFAAAIFLSIALGWFYVGRTLRQNYAENGPRRAKTSYVESSKKTRAQVQAEALERARTWRFGLDREPEINLRGEPAPIRWIAGSTRRTRQVLLEMAVSVREYTEIFLYIQPMGIELIEPVCVTVKARDLFAAKYDTGKLSVVFPEATIDDKGNISSYGKVAVVHGSVLKLPIFKDEDDHLAEEAWRWQLPAFSADLRAKLRPKS